MAFNDGVKVGPVAYIGMMSVLITFVLVLMLQVLYFRWQKSNNEAMLANSPPPSELTSAIAKQQNALTQRGYVDQQRGIVSVGITRAKELVLKELAAGKTPQEVRGPKRPTAPAKKSAEESAKEPAKEPAKAGEEPVVEEDVQSKIGKDEGGSPQVVQEQNDEKKS